MKVKAIWFVIIIVDIVLVFLNKSTFDDGDSILHFLQAHQVMQTPHLLLDMWAKPVFVLLAWPFAAVGWWGMKLFNAICVLASAFVTYKLFITKGYRKWWAVLLCLATPALFLVQSSGLTEPLFTLLLILIVFLEYKDQTIPSLVILSFLPFVRAEGWVIMLIFATYLLFARKIKKLPFMLLGTLLYGLVGQLFLSDFLFMFHQNPYNGVEQKFGNGEFLHYFNQLPYIVGLPIVILISAGFINGIKLLITRTLALKDAFLIYAFSLGYIVAQSIFWRFGLFHSFGMTRVLIVIIPLLAFVAYDGLQAILTLFSTKYQKYITIFFLLLIVLFPFTNNKMGFKLHKSFQLSSNQHLVIEVAEFLKKEKLDSKPFYCNAYYLPMIMHKHVETKQECSSLELLHSTKPKQGSLLVWDSYFAVTDAEITDTFIEQNLNTRLLREFVKTNDPTKYKIKVYEVLSESEPKL
jgi:hypothetical protein